MSHPRHQVGQHKEGVCLTLTWRRTAAAAMLMASRADCSHARLPNQGAGRRTLENVTGYFGIRRSILWASQYSADGALELRPGRECGREQKKPSSSSYMRRKMGCRPIGDTGTRGVAADGAAIPCQNHVPCGSL
jgi:hypothetical protein